MEGSYTVPADQATVWASLNDPDVLRCCISGCRTLVKLSDTRFVATASMKVGPLRASVRVTIELRDVDAPNGCRILGEGEGGLAGFARGAADIRLTAVPNGTMVSYAVEANVGGRIAKLGGWLIDGVGKRMAGQFFTAFAAAVAGKKVAAE